MLFWSNCRKAISLAATCGFLTLQSIGCSCDGEREQAKRKAKARVGARVNATPIQVAAGEKLPADMLHKERKGLDRIWRMPWREARLRLKTHHVWQASAQLSYDGPGGKGLSIDEEAELRAQHAPEAMDLSVSNDGGFFQRIIFSNGMLYRKYQNGDYVASKDLESKRLHYGDEAFALATTGWDLIGRFIGLKPGKNATIANHPAWCYDLVLAAKPEPFKPRELKGDMNELKGWRATLKVNAVTGIFCVDRKTAVPLKINMNAEATRSLEAGASTLKIALKSGFLSLNKAPAIGAPEDYLKSLRRKRRQRGPKGSAPTEYLKKEGINVLPRPDAGPKP